MVRLKMHSVGQLNYRKLARTCKSVRLSLVNLTLFAVPLKHLFYSLMLTHPPVILVFPNDAWAFQKL